MINNNNQNGLLAKKDFLTWIFNPFYILIGLNTKERYHFVAQLPTMKKANSEKELTDFPIKQREIINKFFEDNDMVANFGGKFSIISLTYLFALYIATDSGLRKGFYERYLGKKIPAFFQFLLNFVRLGELDENYSVSNIEIDPVIKKTIRDFGINYMHKVSKFSICENFKIVIEWFDLLERLCAEKNLFFNFVELEKTSLLSNQKLSLTGFNQNNKKFLLNSKLENSKFKKNLLILNKAVNANLVLSKEFCKDSSDFERKLLPIFFEVEESNFKSSDEEYELASQLIDFIRNCSAKDLVV